MSIILLSLGISGVFFTSGFLASMYYLSTKREKPSDLEMCATRMGANRRLSLDSSVSHIL